MSDAQIDAVQRDSSAWGDVFDERELAALALADSMCGDTETLDPSVVDPLKRLFTETERAELVLVCGQANLNNRAGNAAKQVLTD